MSDVRNPQQFGPLYHGTHMDYAVGDEVLPAPAEMKIFPKAADRVYSSTREGLARAAAVLASERHGGVPHVYEIAASEREQDPEWEEPVSWMHPSARVVRKLQ